MPQIILQAWREFERGWGSRPDGISAHVSQQDLEVFEKEYGGLGKPFVPDEYSAPLGGSFSRSVSEDVFDGLKAICKTRNTRGVFVTNTSTSLDEASFGEFERQCREAAKKDLAR